MNNQDKKEVLKAQAFTEKTQLVVAFRESINNYLEKENGMSFQMRQLIVSRSVNELHMDYNRFLQSEYAKHLEKFKEVVNESSQN